MSLIFQATSYFTYWLDAVDSHSLHSPFFYRFYREVVQAKRQHQSKREALRTSMKKDKRVITVHDLGAGASFSKSSTRKVSDIAKTSLSPTKYSELYHRSIDYFASKTLVELGTSLGINALYLAAHPGTHLYTFEGAPAIANIARENFAHFQMNNITLINGNIQEKLPQILDQVNQVDWVLFDANHRYQPTIDYFMYILPKLHNHSILVFDDIYLSPEMTKAWKYIQNHPDIWATADLYRCGFAFLNPDLGRQHHVLAF